MGLTIRSRRSGLRLSQQKLARELGMSQVFLSKIELGKYLPAPNIVAKLAELFHCSKSKTEDM